MGRKKGEGEEGGGREKGEEGRGRWRVKVEGGEEGSGEGGESQLWLNI